MTREATVSNNLDLSFLNTREGTQALLLVYALII